MATVLRNLLTVVFLRVFSFHPLSFYYSLMILTKFLPYPLLH
ncbi:hypothetical protein E2C01_049835 [Portunus trituberculatus]|uniref:Uncharacterized protein n=1 Tax=Portunus trituberculatus TaxID=210409 RepID=A0A5B7G6N4_PORTR|nr:hypothetical protein [Portunus trituberculatus]